jgi:hypothetical protein
MDHSDLYLLRETYNQKDILLCFNGPFSQGLIEEIGSALKRHLQSEAGSSSSALDVFAVYIELAQNIREYSRAQDYSEMESSATCVVGRNREGRYEISAGNVVEPGDAEKICERVQQLSQMDKAQLKAAYKERLRAPRAENDSAGLGLIDVARKASAPISCSVRPINSGQKMFFSLRVEI